MSLKILPATAILSALLLACQNSQLPTTSSVAAIDETFAADLQVSVPRVINMTDLGADPDDEQSLVRQLVMANDFALEGLIVSTGCWKKSQDSTRMLDKIVDAYELVFPNLSIHADGFPTPDYLRSIAAMGQTGYGMSDVGDGKDSAGSNMIIRAVGREDPRPVWIMCWGGCNPIAQALWDVRQSRSEEELAEFVSRLHVYDVLGQDDAGTWIAKTFPDLLYIRATSSVYSWQPSEEWVAEHIQSHGPLGAVYPDTKYATEGDTPAFLHVYPNGLNDPVQVSQGGWGGRFSDSKLEGVRGMECMKGEDADYDPYFMYGDAPEGGEANRRWKSAIENDFEARMDWSITSEYELANHHPIAVLNGDKTRRVLELDAKAGGILTLSAMGSNDPDDDDLTYTWYAYDAPSDYKGSIEITGNSSVTANVHIPDEAAGKTLHVILEVSDSGAPSLISYRRVMIRVSP